jgi:hypothetical protein
MKRWVLGLVALGMISVSAQAATEAGYDSRTEAERIATAIDQGGLGEETNNALNAIIKAAIRALHRKGQHQEAERIEREWKAQSAYWAAGAWDLGDHAPLIPWLQKVYLRLEKVLGEALMRSLRLYDLHVLNHALPVVFNPSGRDWDRVEYRKHFVPLAGVVTYWGTYLGCQYVVKSPKWGRICDPAAGWARWWMEYSVGRGLSDRVYRQFVSDEK